jgi:hypothetical protein
MEVPEHTISSFLGQDRIPNLIICEERFVVDLINVLYAGISNARCRVARLVFCCCIMLEVTLWPGGQTSLCRGLS